MNILWLLIVGVVVFVLATFGAQNGQPVALEYFGVRLSSVPLWMVAIIPAAAGVLLGLLMALPQRVRGSLARRRDAKTLQARDQTGGQQLQRITELERDLTAARQPAQRPARDDLVAPSLTEAHQADARAKRPAA